MKKEKGILKSYDEEKKGKKIVKIILSVIGIVALLFILNNVLFIFPPVPIFLDENTFIDAGECPLMISMSWVNYPTTKQEGFDPNEDKGFYSSYESFPNIIKENVKNSQFDFNKYNYYLIPINKDEAMTSVKPVFKSINGNTMHVTPGYHLNPFKCEERMNSYFSTDYHCYFVKLDKDSQVKDVKVERAVEMNGRWCWSFGFGAVNKTWKPMIYIYPEKEMDVSVKLGNSNLIDTSYPKYENGWNVKAKPNGDLEYNGKTYYGLYWDGKNYKAYEEDYGFVVKGEDTAKFLEEKLAILGLTEREANEMIVYWLPKMEHNKYNYIKFDSMKNINTYMPLNIEPKPETLIRVYMQYKKLDKYKEVKEQELTKVERKGYTVVEWGGTEIE